MRERIVIVFIAIAIGLIVTTLIFLLYQQTRSIDNAQGPVAQTLSPAPNDSSYFLQVDEPQDEALSDKRSIRVRGKTNPENAIVVSTNQEDVAAKPTPDGKFSVTITIDTGANIIITRAITSNGEILSDTRAITFNTEEF